MDKFKRFIILALLGFVLGGGLAYIQGMQEAGKAPASEVAAEADVKAPVAGETPAVPEAATAEANVPGAGTPVPAMPETSPAPVAGGAAIGGAFTLMAHHGLPVTEQSWPGQMKLIFFGFTHCPDVCPAALGKMTAVMEALGADAERVQPLFITTDPARDTPEALAAYIANYHKSIIGLTGSDEMVKQAIDGYKVYAAKVEGADPENYMMDHSTYMYLMSTDNQSLEIFKSEQAAEEIVEKIKAHLPAVPAAGGPSAEAPAAETPVAETPATEAPAEMPAEAPTEVPAPAAE